MTWLRGFDSDTDYLVYKDGDIHNITLENLRKANRKQYVFFRLRNTEFSADDIEKRKQKLRLVIEETTATLHYFETLDMSLVNNHVQDYLYTCLMTYCKETLFLGEKVALDIVPDCIARMYEVIMNGMCLYNYERYCKKLLLNYKRKGNFGVAGSVPKPIEINVKQLNLDCLWERYKKSTRK